MYTKKLEDFDLTAIEKAIELLKLYKTDRDFSSLKNDVRLCLEKKHNKVYLQDRDYCLATRFDGYMVDWLICPRCGYENFAPDFIVDAPRECCKKFYDKKREKYKS